MNNKGEIKLGQLVILAAIVFFGVMFLVPGGWQGILGGAPATSSTPAVSSGNCPSTGLTTVTLNAYQALASTPTTATVTYYVYDKSGKFITSGTTAAGTSSFTLGCGQGIKYDVVALNETPTTGFYAQSFEVPADSPTYTKNLQMYLYGSVNFVNLISSVDPAGHSNISAGPGKTCGLTATFTVNKTASAINNPILVFTVNTSAVDHMTWTGLNPVDSKIPSRLSASAGYRLNAFELPKVALSTDSAYKIGGTITFLSTASQGPDGMSAIIVDQATWRKAAYTSLSSTDGFLESAQNAETIADVGAGDSQPVYLNYTSASGYC